jgi:hypothetical protein
MPETSRLGGHVGTRSMLANMHTPPVIREYKGKQREADSQFRADCIEMAARGYFPKWQSWAPGEWPREAYVVAVLLIFLFGLGVFVLAYLLIAEPDGTFTVTYEADRSGRLQLTG